MKVAIETLVLDYALYPRSGVDDIHVADMAEAIKAGAVLPPITVDATTKRVVDGFHRIAASKKQGHTHIKVNFKQYENEADLYLDAVRLNAVHGKKFSHFDQAGIIAKASELQIDPEIAANAMHISKERFSELILKKTGQDGQGRLVPIKHSTDWLAGREISETQRKGLAKAGGMPAPWYARQLIHLLQSDLVDWTNPGFVAVAAELAGLLEAGLVAVQEKAVK